MNGWRCLLCPEFSVSPPGGTRNQTDAPLLDVCEIKEGVTGEQLNPEQKEEGAEEEASQR